MSDPTPVTASDREVLITHVFDAPRERVFKAWTDPDEVAAWFGPAQMDTPRELIRIDLRIGGRYELTMVRPDGGGEFAIGYEIVELVEPELLVLRSDPMPGQHEPTLVRVELHDHGAKTRMTLSDGPCHPRARPRRGRGGGGVREAPALRGCGGVPRREVVPLRAASPRGRGALLRQVRRTGWRVGPAPDYAWFVAPRRSKSAKRTEE